MVDVDFVGELMKEGIDPLNSIVQWDWQIAASRLTHAYYASI